MLSPNDTLPFTPRLLHLCKWHGPQAKTDELPWFLQFAHYPTSHSLVSPVRSTSKIYYEIVLSTLSLLPPP